MNLKAFFSKHPKVALAFSGGVDSAYLLSVAKKYANDVCAYYVKSAFQPEFELNDAIRLAALLKTPLKIIHIDILSDTRIIHNPVNRCYYCKKAMLSAIIDAAKKDGYSILLDGTNASDDENDRPGVCALHELSVISPLKLCNLTKTEIRQNSHKEGLFTWNKPAYACLATRIPTGEIITTEKLTATEKSEAFLFSLGFIDFRVRTDDGHARILLQEAQWPKLLAHRQLILDTLKQYYKSVVLDLEVRK